ncbi:hypothetical protein CVT24_012833 [Panaeolus cyanescens]|uniref:Uncharacterized protein n=1 Tax=Panaeolus cyanescens TaxID=181874 RepID=A0A409W6I7_9AGAR|nr:hypothetical protein CVT24_012833 [Panaeolus cyanescens]
MTSSSPLHDPSSSLKILQEDHLFKARYTSFPVHDSSSVTCLSVLPDGRIISASDDSTIRIDSVNDSGTTAHILEGHSGGIWCMDVYDNRLVTGSTDHTICVWDMERNTRTHLFAGHMSTVRALQIVKPDVVNVGKNGRFNVTEEWPKRPLIVSGGRESDLHVWMLPRDGDADFYPGDNIEEDSPESLVEGNPYHLHRLEGHTAAVRAVNARGRICVSGSYDNDVRVWDIITGECRWVLRGHVREVYSVELDIERQLAYSGSMNASIIVWDLETGTMKHQLEGHTSLVGIIKLTPSYNYLLSGSADSFVCVWNTATVTGEPVHKFQPGTTAVTALASDDEYIVCASDGVVTVWDLREGKLMKTLLEDMKDVRSVFVDDKRVVCAGTSKDNITMMHVWELR